MPSLRLLEVNASFGSDRLFSSNHRSPAESQSMTLDDGKSVSPATPDQDPQGTVLAFLHIHKKEKAVAIYATGTLFSKATQHK